MYPACSAVLTETAMEALSAKGEAARGEGQGEEGWGRGSRVATKKFNVDFLYFSLTFP